MKNRYSDLSDAQIVSKILSGDIEEFAEIITRYESRLIRYVSYLVGSQVSAADIVQDTFIKAYVHLRGYDSRYKFSSWIYRIAHNEAMSAVVKRRHISDADVATLTEASYDFDFTGVIDAEILADDVAACLRKLDRKYREIVQLIYFENMKYEEASDILRIPTSTVGVRLSRAKKQLKEICIKQGTKR